jgi:tetratricopeptide (TPR) repeat protein
MEIPDIQFPVDLSGGPASFRDRRCSLQRATLVFAEGPTARWLADRVSQTSHGTCNISLHFGQGLFDACGQVVLGGAAADFVFRGLVEPAADGLVRVALVDLRLYGAFPVAAPLLAAGLLRAVGAGTGSGFDAELVGCTDVTVDPLRLALLHTLPRGGWRIPHLATAPLYRVMLEPGRLILDYSRERRVGAIKGVTPAEIVRFAGAQEAKSRFASAEEAILSQGPGAAIDLYRRHLEDNPSHPFLIERLLQLLSADTEQEEETLELARRARGLHADFVPALLAEANVRSRRGEMDAAAWCYHRLAELAAQEAMHSEEVIATLTAGSCVLSLDRQQATREFERALALDPDSDVALSSLAPLYAEAAEWQRLVQIRERQIARARSEEARVHSHLALGELFRVHLADAGQARGQYQLALSIDPCCEPALRGLAETCISTDDLLEAVRALDLLCAMAAERQEPDTEVAGHLRIASLWEHLGDAQSALARLRRALEIKPDDPQALRRAAVLLSAMDRQREAADLLERLVSSLPDPQGKADVLRQAAEIWILLGEADEAWHRARLAVSLAPEDVSGLRLVLRIAERRGQVADLADSLDGLAARTTDPAEQSALLLRRGTLLATTGALSADAVACLERAVDGSPDGGFAALREIALLHHRAESWDKELLAWSRLVETEQGRVDAEGWYNLGLAGQRMTDLPHSRDALERALALAPDPTFERDCLSVLVVVARAQGDARRASHLERLLPLLDPTNHVVERREMLLELAELKRAAKDLAGAAETMRQATAVFLEDVDLLDLLAQIEEERGQLDSARIILEQVLHLIGDEEAAGPRRAALALRLAATSEAQNRVREAIDYYRRALGDGLPIAEADHAWNRIIELLLDRGDAEAAGRAAEAAAGQTEDPNTKVERLVQAGQIWLKRADQPDLALQCFQKVLELRPRHAIALDVLEAVWAERGDHEPLVEVLRVKVEAAAKRPPAQKALLVRLAQTLVALGRPDEARAAYTRALSLDADYTPALRFLARDTFGAGQFERAEVYYRRLLASMTGTTTDVEPAPADASAVQVEAYLRLAELARRRNQNQEEEGHLEMALAVDPRNAEALERLDALLVQQHRAGELVEIIRRRSEIAPDLDTLVALESRRADALESLPGRRDDAAAAYRQVLLLAPTHEWALERLAGILRETRNIGELVEIVERWAEALEARSGANRAAGDLWFEAAQLSDTRLEQEDRAEMLYRRALRCCPHDAAMLEALLRVLQDHGDPAETEDLLRRLIAQSREPLRQAALETQLAACLESRGDKKGALHLIAQAVVEDRVTPGLVSTADRVLDTTAPEVLPHSILSCLDGAASVDARVELLLRAANVLREQLARPSEALFLVQEARAVRPGSARVLWAAAELLQVTGQLQLAEESLLTLAEQSEETEAALDQAAGVAHLRGDAVAEARTLTRLAALRPGDAATVLRLVQACRAAGDLQALARALEQRAEVDPEALLEAAQLYAGLLSDLASAFDAYRRYLQAHLEDQSALQAMVEVCDALGRREEAATYLRRLRDTCAPGRRRLDLNLEIARREEVLGRTPLATQAWREAVDQAPEDVELITHLAESLARENDWDALCALLEEKLSGDGVKGEARGELCARLGETYLDQRNDPRAAISWLSAACALSSGQEKAFRRLRQLYLECHDHAALVDLLRQRIERLEGTDRSALWQDLGQLLEAQAKDPRGAAQAYAAAFREDPRRNTQAAHRAHTLFMRGGDPDAALAVLDELLAHSTDEDRPAVFAARARVMVGQGLLVEAVQAYESVLALAPHFHEAHAELGRLRFGQGSFRDALPHLQAAGDHLENPAASSTCAFLAGRAAEKLGLLDEALAWYEKAVSRNPAARAPYEALAPLYERRGAWANVAGVLSALCTLVTEANERANLLCRLAAVQRRLGQPDAARENLERAVTLDATRTEPVTLLRELAEAEANWVACADLRRREIQLVQDPPRRARLHRELGQLLAGPLQDSEAAISALSAALDLDPDDTTSAALLVSLFKKTGRHDDAALLERRSLGRTEPGAAIGIAAAPRAASPTEPIPLAHPPTSAVPAAPPLPPGSQDAWPEVHVYRARAADDSRPKEERAELLLAAAKTLEEKLSRPLEALAACEEAVALVPTYAPAVEAFAHAAYRNQDWHRARDLYDQLWRDPSERAKVEICYRRGLVYETLGDEQTADRSYSAALALDPKHRVALEGRSRLALFREDNSTAIDVLTQLERLITVDELEVLADVRQQLGRLLLREGRLDAAKAYLEGVLTLDSKRVRAMQSLLRVYEGKGEHQAMLSLLAQLMTTTADPLVRATFLYQRAEVLGARLGNEEAAIDCLLRAYDLAPEYPPTLWRLVDYYWERGDLESVAEMGTDLAAAEAIDAETPDLRYVRLAAATLLVHDDSQTAGRLLGMALGKDDLVEPALLDLARVIAAGHSALRIAKLVREADTVGALHARGVGLAARDPSPPGLSALIQILGALYP